MSERDQKEFNPDNKNIGLPKEMERSQKTTSLCKDNIRAIIGRSRTLTSLMPRPQVSRELLVKGWSHLCAGSITGVVVTGAYLTLIAAIDKLSPSGNIDPIHSWISTHPKEVLSSGAVIGSLMTAYRLTFYRPSDSNR